MFSKQHNIFCSNNFRVRSMYYLRSLKFVKMKGLVKYNFLGEFLTKDKVFILALEI